jgi:nitroreductase
MENKFLDAMNFRHACKEFDETKKISDEDFNFILETGRLSPSSFGFEPWKFLVIENEILKEKLKAFTWGAQGQLPTSSRFIIILARKDMRYDSEFIKHMMQDVKQMPEDAQKVYSKFYEDFQVKDFKLLQSDRALFDWSCKQTYIAMANMLTGAAYLGIDSCPIEGFDMDIAEKFLEEELGIDTQKFGMSVMITFGYRKNNPKRGLIRQELDDIVSWYK